jgi:hypothetical protein
VAARLVLVIIGAAVLLLLLALFYAVGSMWRPQPASALSNGSSDNADIIVPSSSSPGDQQQQLDRVLKVTAKTDDNKTVYGYGKIIPLNVTILNSGNQIINVSSSELRPYAGLGHSCASELYFDFVVLKGDHSQDIAGYDDLLRLKEEAIYVFDPPFLLHSCLSAYVKTINNVTIYPGVAVMPDIPFWDGDSKFTINFMTRSGHPYMSLGSTLPYAYIRDVYREGVNPETGRPSVERSPLLPGKYTVVAFTLSGQLSKPLVLEVTAVPDLSFLWILAAACASSVIVLAVSRYRQV